jgi:hypothetical protein
MVDPCTAKMKEQVQEELQAALTYMAMVSCSLYTFVWLFVTVRYNFVCKTAISFRIRARSCSCCAWVCVLLLLLLVAAAVVLNTLFSVIQNCQSQIVFIFSDCTYQAGRHSSPHNNHILFCGLFTCAALCYIITLYLSSWELLSYLPIPTS